MAEMERHSEDVNKRLVWMQHLARLMDAMKLIVVCHLARLVPLLLKWAHAYDAETVVMVRKRIQEPNALICFGFGVSICQVACTSIDTHRKKS